MVQKQFNTNTSETLQQKGVIKLPNMYMQKTRDTTLIHSISDSRIVNTAV